MLQRFGQYAFIAPNNPSSSDEKEFKDAIEAIMERPVTPAEMVGFRRLWFESHAVAMSDLRNRVERSSSDPPKQVPLAETYAQAEEANVTSSRE